MNLFVAGFSPDTTQEDLHAWFSEHGTVRSLKIILDRETGKSKCYGFVEMPDARAAECAIAALDGSRRGKRKLTVNEARPRRQRRKGSESPRQRRSSFIPPASP